MFVACRNVGDHRHLEVEAAVMEATVNQVLLCCDLTYAFQCVHDQAFHGWLLEATEGLWLTLCCSYYNYRENWNSYVACCVFRHNWMVAAVNCELVPEEINFMSEIDFSLEHWEILLDDVSLSVDSEWAKHCSQDHVLIHPIVSNGPLDNSVHSAMELVAEWQRVAFDILWNFYPMFRCWCSYLKFQYSAQLAVVLAALLLVEDRPLVLHWPIELNPKNISLHLVDWKQ